MQALMVVSNRPARPVLHVLVAGEPLALLRGFAASSEAFSCLQPLGMSAGYGKHGQMTCSCDTAPSRAPWLAASAPCNPCLERILRTGVLQQMPEQSNVRRPLKRQPAGSFQETQKEPPRPFMLPRHLLLARHRTGMVFGKVSFSQSAVCLGLQACRSSSRVLIWHIVIRLSMLGSAG